MNKLEWMNAISLALGVLVGNWLISPLILPGRTFNYGLCVGIIAAALTVLFCWLLHKCGI